MDKNTYLRYNIHKTLNLNNDKNIIQNQITFCIYYYGKEQKHTKNLETNIKQVIKFYPDNPILICKTSDSYMPDISEYKNVRVFNAFINNIHILGGIELLLREHTTSHFIIYHDSMFLLKPLPKNIFEKELYNLWYFKRCRGKFDVNNALNKSKISRIDIENLQDLYNNSFPDKWYGMFGPAFGGNINKLKEFWKILNINDFSPYLGRNGLVLCERYFALIFLYMGIDTKDSLNGDIYQQIPLCENIPILNEEDNNWKYFLEIPDFKYVNENHSYFYKILQNR